MLRDFEKDGCKYSIGELVRVDGVQGQWCTKYEWHKDKKAFLISNSTFVPAFGFPKTRQRIVDCFHYGTGFVYLREKQKRREKWLQSPQYADWIEMRRIQQ